MHFLPNVPGNLMRYLVGKGYGIVNEHAGLPVHARLKSSTYPNNIYLTNFF
jgi:hypothetical protein